MGVVFKAYEISLERMVALKVIHPEIAHNPSLLKRLRHEAILAAKLVHPYIVTIHHIEKGDNPHYFTMDFVQGKSLTEKVEQEGFLSPDQAIRIVLQACEALQYAHAHNVIHRDIKPSNIMLENDVERVRITDFGIARDLTDEYTHLTQTEHLPPVSLGFGSPEQILGQKMDARTDIFSLGMTFYYMLTGRIAYASKNRAELAVVFREKKPLPPSRYNSDVRQELDKIVLKMIAVNTTERYQNISEVMDALRGCTQDIPRSDKRRHLPWISIAVLFIALMGIFLYVYPRRHDKIPKQVDLSSISWVYIDDAGVPGHEGFTGEMSKYETTNAQYCQFLNDALASGDITVGVDNIVYGASGSNSGADFVGQVYFNLAGPGETYDGATNGGAARINHSSGVFTVDSGLDNHPVTYVSWYGSTAFCNYYGYRLPTEWEWQAVADFDESFTYGCGTSINNSIANYLNSIHPHGTTVVGSLGDPSGYGYGMCDMAGNVWEWTSTGGSQRVLRGGSWYYGNNYCTVSYSYSLDQHRTFYNIGFRVCR